MALAFAVQGATRPSPAITWQIGDNEVLNLTGATLTGTITGPDGTRAIAGTLAVSDAPNGVFTWTYGAADVVDAGHFWVQFTATFGTGPTPARTELTEWVVKRAA